MSVMLLSFSIQIDIHNKHLDYCLLPPEYVMSNMLWCNGNQKLPLYCGPVLWKSIKTKYYVNESCWSKQSSKFILYQYREIVTSLEPIRGVASYDSCVELLGTGHQDHTSGPCQGLLLLHLVRGENIPATSIWLERLQTALCHWVSLTSIIYYNIQKHVSQSLVLI